MCVAYILLKTHVNHHFQSVIWPSSLRQMPICWGVPHCIDTRWCPIAKLVIPVYIGCLIRLVMRQLQLGS